MWACFWNHFWTRLKNGSGHFFVTFGVPKWIQKGEFISSIPSEGGFLWGLAWRIGTGLEFKLKYNLDYSNLMRHEHINSCFEILFLLKIIFQDVEVYKFGLGNHFSLYQCIKCSNPKFENIEKFI